MTKIDLKGISKGFKLKLGIKKIKEFTIQAIIQAKMNNYSRKIIF
jgi:hypothetical protein